MTDPTRSTLHQQVVEELGAAIVHRDLEPGTVIPIDELEKRFAASRTAIREALKVLAAKGLVGARPRRGTYVQTSEKWVLLDADVLRWRWAGPLEPSLLADLDQLRHIIEPPAAALAAKNRTEDHLTRMEIALSGITFESVEGKADHIEADIAFHTAVLDATGNELLSSLRVMLEPTLRMRDRLVYGAVTDDPHDAHAAVADAIRDQDPEAAERAMRSLIEEASVGVLVAMQQRGKSGD